MAEQIRTVTREFETGDHAVLHVEGRSGTILVEGRQIDRVQVEATVRIWTDIGAEADDAAALVERAMEQDGNRAIVRAPSLPEGGGGWRMLGMRGSRVDYQIRVPLRSAVRVLSRSGRVEITRVQGRVHSEVLSGRLSITDVTGDVTMVSKSGSVGVERIQGNVTADVRSGRVKVNDVSGNVSVEVRSGAFESAKVQGDLRVRGRSGPMTIEEAGGAVNANSRCGPFRYRGRVEGDFDIDVHTGPITLEVDPDRPFFIDAESRVGPVSSDLPTRRGAGGGVEGPKVRLRTGTGPIRVTRG